MRIIFLGTNGWYNTETGNTSCVLVETDTQYIVFDAGEGIHKLDQYVKDTRPIHLFISHLHLDHITGFHVFNKFSFKQKVTIYGSLGIRDYIRRVFCKPFSVDPETLSFEVEFKVIKEELRLRELRIEARPLQHSVPCQGYRLEYQGRSVAYCADTGPCDNVRVLARDADLVITECSFRRDTGEPGAPHLDPEGAARIASAAGCRRLALTHFSPAVFPSFADRQAAQAQAQKIFPQSVTACDGMEIEL